MSQLDFNRRVAIVTGAGNGMGRCHALMLASRGCRVVVNDLSKEASDKVVAEIEAAGGIAASDNHNVVTQAQQAVRTAIDHFGQLDILVNNAGTWIGTSFEETSPATYDACFDVSYKGTVEMCRAAWPHLKASGTGRIINISSSGSLGNAGLTSYGSAKAAVLGFTKSLADESAEHGIMVNALLPTARTSMTENIKDEFAMNTLNKFFDPSHVSAMVSWLCHQDTKVNNEAIRVGGGTAARIFFSQMPMVRAEEMTPETWANQADDLLKDGELTPLVSCADLFGRELVDADPDTEFDSASLGF